jgi:RNA polymerase sigma-B factor
MEQTPVDLNSRRYIVRWGDRECRLLAQARRDGDRRLMDQLFEEMLPLARRLAFKHARSPDQVDDLVQVASLALFRALQRFDLDRGVDFPAFAVPTIDGELRHYHRDFGWSVRPPRSLMERSYKINLQLDRLLSELGRPPTLAELAERCKMSVEEVREGQQAGAAHMAVSLDAPIDGAADLHPTPGAEDPGYRLVEEVDALKPVVRVLPIRERQILALRFEEGLTQHEIAKRVGLSQMHVSRLLRRALERIEPFIAEAA